MAKLTGDDGEVRRQSLRGAFYVCVRNGQIVMSAWPRKRPGPMSEKQAYAVEKFKQAAFATKLMDPEDQAMARVLTKRTNALPRDLLMMALYGRLGTIFLQGGKRIYSLATLKDAASLLDAITYDKGSMLFRGDEYWWRIPIGETGQVLTVNGDGEPSWKEPQGGGGGSSDASGSSLLQLSTDHVTALNTWAVVNEWGSVRDPNGAWSTLTPERLTAPSGTLLARLTMKLAWANNGNGARYAIINQFDNASNFKQAVVTDIRGANNETLSSSISPWVGVDAGDYFVLSVNPGSTTAKLMATGFGTPTWMQAEWA